MHGAIPDVQGDQSCWEEDTNNKSCWKLGIVCAWFECCLQMPHSYLCVFLARRRQRQKKHTVF